MNLLDLRDRLEGELVLPGDEGWDAARLAWQLLVDQRPVAVVVASNVDDITATLAVARAAGLKVSPQSTGHAAGTIETLRDTVLLRTTRLKDVRIDPEAMIARVRDMGLRLGGEVFHRQSAMARAGDLGRLAEITQPTLIIAADADRLRGPDEAEELPRGIAGSTMGHIANSGHMIPLEQPKALARVMTSWLKTLS